MKVLARQGDACDVIPPMRPPLLRAIAAVLPIALAPGASWAQPARGPCAPTIELGASLPPRMVQRLRRVLDHAAGRLPAAAPCSASRARLEWNDRELTVHIALDDGRIAVRNLESLEDVLPTLLSVLAVPAPDPPVAVDPPASPPPAEPATAPDAAPTAAPSTPRPTVAPAARPPARWSLLVSLSAGASWQLGDGGAWRWGAEVGAATPRLALSARSAMAYAFGDRHAPLQGEVNVFGAQRDHDASSLVLSGRARFGWGRLRAEVGGFGGVSFVETTGSRVWSPRFGLEASLGAQVTRALAVFARAEGFVDLGTGLGPGVALSVGTGWEPQR